MQTAKDSVTAFSRQFLVADGIKCARHCEKPARFVPLLEESDRLVGAYVCPDEYVSRVVYFSTKPDMNWFEVFLRDQVGGRLRSRDLRYATRHGWELGHEAEKRIKPLVEPGKGLGEAYWTFYARSDEDKKSGTFLCSSRDGGCDSRLYTKRLDDQSKKLCSSCQSKTSGK